MEQEDNKQKHRKQLQNQKKHIIKQEEFQHKPLHDSKKPLLISFDGIIGLHDQIKRIKIFYEIIKIQDPKQLLPQEQLMFKSINLFRFSKTNKNENGFAKINEIDRLSDVKITDLSYMYVEIRAQISKYKDKTASKVIGWGFHKFLRHNILENGALRIPVHSPRIDPQSYINSHNVKKPIIHDAFLLFKVDYPNSPILKQEIKEEILKQYFYYKVPHYNSKQIGVYKEVKEFNEHVQNWITGEQLFINYLMSIDENQKSSSQTKQILILFQRLLKADYFLPERMQYLLQLHGLKPVHIYKKPNQTKNKCSKRIKNKLISQFTDTNKTKLQDQDDNDKDSDLSSDSYEYNSEKLSDTIYTQSISYVSQVDFNQTQTNFVDSEDDDDEDEDLNQNQSKHNKSQLQKSYYQKYKNVEWNINVQILDKIDKKDQGIGLGLTFNLINSKGLVQDINQNPCQYDSDIFFVESQGIVSFQIQRTFQIDFSKYNQEDMYFQVQLSINNEGSQKMLNIKEDDQIYGWGIYPICYKSNKKLIEGQLQKNLFKYSTKQITFPFQEENFKKTDQILYFQYNFKEIQ